MDVLRICLWSGPRNVSTALMYAFAQRDDTRAIDEPLYAHYLRVSGAAHPGADEVIASMESDGERVIRDVILGPCDRPVLFMKQMAHHLVAIDWDFMKHTTNVLLTRDPVDMLPSLAKILDTPTLRDTGYATQYELLKRFKQFGQNPPVINARELLLNPPSVLRQLCERLGIPFQASMLRWQAGPHSEDGVWAKHWYHNAHRTTGFQPYRKKAEPFPEELVPLLEECQPYYQALQASAIKCES
jgi:hypothetical protein